MIHLGDDAELYALSLLPVTDRPRIEAHLVECDLCLRRVVEAERTAWRLGATLDSTSAPRRRSSARRLSPVVAWATGLAAAFALATGLQSYRLSQADTSIASTSHALSVVAAAHFNHVTMTPQHGALVAKVLYSKDRTWIYCIADSHERYTVSGLVDGTWRTLAQTQPDGAVSAAFVSDAGPVDEVILRDAGNTVVADARLQ